ncbi:hypothetical protein [Streptomyces sp. NPDC003299]
MDTYALRSRRPGPWAAATGHYRKPGTGTSYCGRALAHEPTPAERFGSICQPCTKAEANDRATAQAVAEEHREGAPASDNYGSCEWCGWNGLLRKDGTMRKHRPQKDAGRTGRTGSLPQHMHAPFCQGSGKAPFTLRPENAVITQADAEQAPAANRDEPSDWWTITDPATGEEIARVYGETWQDMTPRAEALPEVRAVIRRHNGFSRRRLFVSELTPEQRAAQTDAKSAAQFDRAARAVDAVEHAEQAGARVDTVEDAEALYAATADSQAKPYDVLRAAVLTEQGEWTTQRAADLLADHGLTVGVNTAWGLLLHFAEREHLLTQTGRDAFTRPTVEDVEAQQAAALVTEAEATAGTWRGEWIGEQTTDTAPGLFPLDREQGALFA